MTIRVLVTCGLLFPAAITLQTPPAAAQSGSDLFELIDLGTLGGRFSGATDVNGFGLVAGSGETRDFEVHAFRWEGKPKLTDLDTLGGGQQPSGCDQRCRAGGR